MAELPPPISVTPSRLIEHVFPVPSQPEVPDIASQRLAEQFLVDRYDGPPPEGSDPSVVYVPTQVPQTPVAPHLVWPRSDKPRDYPIFFRRPRAEGRQGRRWLRANLVGLLALNTAINADQLPNIIRDGVEFGQVAKDHVEDRLHVGRHKVEHVQFTYHTEEQTVPGGPVTEELFAPTQVGEITPEPSAVEQFFTGLGELRARGAVINKAKLFGKASDERLSNPDCDLEVRSSDNIELAGERVVEYKKRLIAEAAVRGVQLPELEITETPALPTDPTEAEKRLSADERKVLDYTAQQSGYSDACAAIAVFNHNPDTLPPILRELIDTRIGKNRGTSLVFEGHLDDQTVMAVIPDVRRFVTNEPDGSPNKKHKYELDLLPFLIPPIPGLHLRSGTKTVMEPVVIEGVEGDDEWLRIYEEGANEDMTLKKEAWAYTRKYQAMFREGRIKNVYNLEYVDAGGAQQNLRILFADHTPHFETIANFPILLQSVIQMRGGNIGHNLDAIVVYPEDNAGTDSRDPKRIGLGIDFQSERDILGTAYYSLGLIEMHMPIKPTEEELHGFVKSLWVFSHENGHFVAHNQTPAQLRAIDGRLERHFVTSEQRADFATPEYERLSALDRGEVPRRRLRDRIMRRPPQTTDRRWWTRQGVQTLVNTTRMMEHDNITDQELRHHRWPLLVRVQNRFPTEYSRTSPSELWADSTAQALTGIGIPFSEQHNFASPPTDPDFARAYAIGTRMLRLIQRLVGSDPHADGISWPRQAEAAKNWVHTMTTIENDPHLSPLAHQARTWEFRHEDDERVYNILARARRSQR